MSTKDQTQETHKNIQPKTVKPSTAGFENNASNMAVPETLVQRVAARPDLLTANDVVHLQRTVGNQAVNQILPQASTGLMIQREEFVGDASKHHLHVDIHQDHYKFGNDRGSRIEIGKGGVYKLDQLIVVRNYLVDGNHTANGGQDCIDWLEEQCQAHADWDEEVGYKPSWEVEEVEENPHVDAIFDYAKGYGYERADFENSFIQAKNEVLEAEIPHLENGNYYGNDIEDDSEPTTEKLEAKLEGADLLELMAGWTGFPTDIYAKDDLAEYFKRYAKEALLIALQDQFPLATGKYA